MEFPVGIIVSADSPASPEDPASPPPPTGEGEAAASDLPEWEPLSPEILEDEAIRGDFVLRWAVVGLALLWGCTQISDARVLVHVRSGEWLAGNGVLPTGVDPFALTTADRRWVNLPWLFDLFVAAGHQAGPWALSVLQAVLAGLVFWLLGHSVRPGIRTWWGSICGGLALLATYPQFELLPDLITLVGVAAVLAILIGYESAPSRRRLWWLPGVMWLWAQTDPRCWIGVAVLLLWLLGNRSRSDADSRTASPTVPILVAVGVTLLHPFLWETWLAPWRQFAIDYPALRASYPRPVGHNLAWYPVWSSFVWTPINHWVAAGLILAGAALAALWLNRSRGTLAHWGWFVGANLLGAVTLHEWPVAAIVNAVLATVHGQEWYKRRFGQVYSVVAAEIAFSRGGRAVTVLAMLTLAWLVISGRVDGPDGHRTGIGLSRNLATELDSLRRLDGRTFDDAGFHFTLRQGDALIAAGRKSFVDHRVGLFAGAADRDLLARHRQVRRWMRSSSLPLLTADETRAVEQTLTEYPVSHALPRLDAALSQPDYQTFLDLLSNPAWMLTDIFPAVAVFHRTTSDNPEMRAFVTAHELNVIERAFGQPAVITADPLDPVRPPNWSERLLSLDRNALAAGTLEASHWLRLAEAGRAAPLPFQLGCCTLAVRAARLGTRETPRLAEAHRMLGEAYRVLRQREAASLGEQAMLWAQSLRFYESVAAAQQGLALEPDNPRLAAQLFDLYQSTGKIDAALEALTRMLDQFSASERLSDEQQAERSQMEAMQQNLASAIGEMEQRSQTALEQGRNRIEVAAACHQAGCVRLAVKLLQDDAVLLEQQPQARLLLTLWLAELGAGDELIDSASRLQAMMPPSSPWPWHDPVAYAALTRADDAAAIEAWQTAAKRFREGSLESLLETAPLTTSSRLWLGDTKYPLAHLAAVQDAFGRAAQQTVLVALNLALCEIERNDPAAAIAALEPVRDSSIESPLRPLVRVYWYCLKGELLDETPAGDQIPMDESLIAPEP
jgi:hypothetical protein